MPSFKVISKIFLCFLIGISFCLPTYAISENDFILQNSFNFRPNNFIEQNGHKFIEDTDANEYIPESTEPLTKYKLNTGDVIQINLIYNKNEQLEYLIKVSPEGKIFLSKIGEFFVANLTTEELKKKIKENITKKIKNVEISVILKKIRSIKVFLTGYALNPGVYSVANETRLLNFLRNSGSITENGSLRAIEIYSSKNTKKVYDLYDFVYRGIIEQNPKLLAGDKIYIPYIKKKVAVTGNVIKPAIYELKEKETPLEIIKLAGGFANGANTSKINIWKNGMYSTDGKTIIFNIDDLLNIELESGDIIFIPSIKSKEEDKLVHIYGQINKQGSILYKEGRKLSDYIKLAGGANPSADMENVKVTRIKKENNEIKSTVLDINAYDVLYNGNVEKDILIEANDVIFIPEKFFNFRTFSDITGTILTSLGIVSLAISFIQK